MEANGGMTQAALLDALRAAMERAPDDDTSALTVQELMAAMDLPVHRARALVKDLIRDGQCEAVRVKRMDMSGRLQTVAAYRFREKGKALRAA